MQNKNFSHFQWAGIGVLLVALCVIFYILYKKPERSYSTTSKTLRFNYTLRNTSGDFIPHADFSIKMPMSVDDIQSVTSINSSHCNKLIKESSSEQSVEFSIESISPYSSKMVDLTLMVNISDKPKYERINDANYLIAEKSTLNWIHQLSSCLRQNLKDLHRKKQPRVSMSGLSIMSHHRVIPQTVGALSTLSKRDLAIVRS